MTRLLATVAILSGCAWSSSARGEEYKVVVVREGELKDGDRVCGIATVGTIYNVYYAVGETAQVDGGWINTQFILPIALGTAYFTEEIQREPDNAVLYHARAYVWVETKSFDLAIADFSQAIKLKPGDAHAYCWRAYCWCCLGNLDAAIADFGATVERDPSNRFAYRWRATCWQKRGDYGRAVADFSAALELARRPNDIFSTLLARGQAHSGNHAYPEALADFGTALQMSPKNPEVYACRGQTLYSSGDYDAAMAEFEAGLCCDPSSRVAAMLHAGKGIVWLGRKKLDEAIFSFDEALQFDPAAHGAHGGRGLALLKQGNFDRAVLDLTEARRLDPHDARVRRYLVFATIEKCGEDRR